MERNGQKINELDLLTLLGLEKEKQNIINQHKRSLDYYEERVRLINIDPLETRYKKVSPLTSIAGNYSTTIIFCYFPVMVMGSFYMLESLIGGLAIERPFIKIVISRFHTPLKIKNINRINDQEATFILGSSKIKTISDGYFTIKIDKSYYAESYGKKNQIQVIILASK